MPKHDERTCKHRGRVATTWMVNSNAHLFLNRGGRKVTLEANGMTKSPMKADATNRLPAVRNTEAMSGIKVVTRPFGIVRLHTEASVDLSSDDRTNAAALAKETSEYQAKIPNAMTKAHGNSSPSRAPIANAT